MAVDEEAGMATLQLNFQTITIGSTTAGSLGWVTTGSAYGYTFTETKYSDSDNMYYDASMNQWQYYTESAKVEVPIGCGEIPVIMHMPKLSSVVKDQDNTQNYVIAVDWSNYLAASDAALDVLSEAVADVQQVLNAYQTIENSGLEAVSDKVWDALAAVQKAGVALGGDANRATNDDAVTKTEATSAADQDAYDTAEALCAVLQLVRVKAPIISVEGYDSSNAINADGNEQLSVTISKNGDATDVIRYSTSDDVTVRDYSGTLTLSGLLQKVRLSAYAATSQYPVRQSNLAYIDINFGEAAEEPTPDNPSAVKRREPMAVQAAPATQMKKIIIMCR